MPYYLATLINEVKDQKSFLTYVEMLGCLQNTHLPSSNFGFYLAVSGYFGDIPLFRSSTKMLKELRGRLIFQVAFAFYDRHLRKSLQWRVSS